jgi:hypothetical protein
MLRCCCAALFRRTFCMLTGISQGALKAAAAAAADYLRGLLRCSIPCCGCVLARREGTRQCNAATGAQVEAAINCSGAVQKLMSELSVWRCSSELKKECARIWSVEKGLDFESIAEERKRRNYDSFWTPVPASEPFRCVLAQVRVTETFGVPDVAGSAAGGRVRGWSTCCRHLRSSFRALTYAVLPSRSLCAAPPASPHAAAYDSVELSQPDNAS